MMIGIVCASAQVRDSALRPDYAAHLEGTLASMYERFSDACLMVERAYSHPAVRVALRLRDLVRRPGA